MLNRIIIAGGRDFNNKDLMHSSLNDLFTATNINNREDVAIVSGLAKGADLLGKQIAENSQFSVHTYPALWDKHGKSAGYKRNSIMANNADYLLAFWDGKSKGTKHMINLAKQHNLPTTVIHY